MTTHQIIERDVAFVEFTLEYDPETRMLRHVRSDVGDSLSSYDAEYRCTCGATFDTYEDAEAHTATHSDSMTG